MEASLARKKEKPSRRKKLKNVRRECIKEFWHRGTLDYKLHEGQKVIRKTYRNCVQQLFVGECARQFGKSFLMVVEAVECALKKRRSRIKYATAFLTDLEEFILPAFEIVLSDCPKSLKPKYKSQKAKYIFPNKSEIKLIGLDKKPNGLRGNAIDLIILDEAGFMSRLDYIYKSVIIPATTHRPDCKILVVSTPPETPAHEFLDYVQRAEMEGGYCKFTIYDNPMVDETTIARLMKESGGANSTTWRREYLCEHLTDADLAIVEEWTDDYWKETPKDEYFGFYQKYVMMDLGVKDPTAALFGYYDFRRAALVIENDFSLAGPKMNTKVLQAHLKHKELETWYEGYKFEFKDPERISDTEIEHVETLYKYHGPKVYLRVSDNNNPLLLQDLSHLHKLHFIPTDKGTLQEMVNAVKILTRDGGLYVDPRCKLTRGCLKYGVWESKRREFARSKVYGHFDALAALIYGVRNLNRSTNPIPADFKTDPSNQILFNLERSSGTVREFKKAFNLG